MLTDEEIRNFQFLVNEYYRAHARSFPWRETRDPYAIWVSEIMLQQTQTVRVVEKYLNFMRLFPTVQDLAAAPLDKVLLAWQGLGYNKRALSLHRSAKIVSVELRGIVPEDDVLLRGLPGIGPYTAAAIRAFAFDRPDVFIETNIRRVFIHHFFSGHDKVADSELMPLVASTLDKADPRTWYYALMDYGADLPKRVANPNRRSAQYTRQSRFEGSTRQVRGLALSYLAQGGKLTAAELARRSKRDKAEALDVLESLYRDGFLVCDGNAYKLTDGSSYSTKF